MVSRTTSALDRKGEVADVVAVGGNSLVDLAEMEHAFRDEGRHGGEGRFRETLVRVPGHRSHGFVFTRAFTRREFVPAGFVVEEHNGCEQTARRTCQKLASSLREAMDARLKFEQIQHRSD